MKIHPVGAELFRVDGRTDTMKLIVAFPYFENSPNDVPIIARCTSSQVNNHHTVPTMRTSTEHMRGHCDSVPTAGALGRGV